MLEPTIRYEAGEISVRMSEADLLQTVRDLCQHLGLLVYHTHDSRRSESGFPDLVVVGGGLLVRELKSATGRVTAAQQRWLDALARAGVDVGVWRPADLRSGAVLGQLRATRARSVLEAAP